MKKGFTLIEIIGVVIILGLVAILAIPAVLNLVKNTENDLDESAKQLIVSATSQYVTKYQNNYIKKENYNYCIKVSDLVKENLLASNIIDDLDKEIEVKIINGNYQYTILDSECKQIYKDKSGASIPELDSGMIPIEITPDGIIKKADIKSEWYDYTNKKWANAVLVSDATRQTYQNAAAGTVISASDIKAYYVWIPRYKYKIFTDVNNLETIGSISGSSQYINKPQVIEVVFEDATAKKSTGTIKNSWLTHPAFTFGNEELNGIWVGKFETTGTASEPTVLGYDSRYTVTNNITSLRNQNVSTQFLTSQKINYGLTKLEASMLKNMEWGAVAYLTASKYGQGKTEVMINNSSRYNTGCAASVSPTTEYRGYLEQTGGSEGFYSGCENEWYTTLGQKASTTGNSYGIYDMSGGAWEYVMGVMEDSLGSGVPASGRNNTLNSGFTGILTNPSSGSNNGITSIIGTSFPNEKYFDIYKYDESLDAYENRGHLGDATYELDSFSNWVDLDGTRRYHNGWHKDYARFVYRDDPWFMRGGCWADGTGVGVFSFFSFHYGSGHTEVSFRSVLR